MRTNPNCVNTFTFMDTRIHLPEKTAGRKFKRQKAAQIVSVGYLCQVQFWMLLFLPSLSSSPPPPLLLLLQVEFSNPMGPLSLCWCAYSWQGWQSLNLDHLMLSLKDFTCVKNSEIGCHLSPVWQNMAISMGPAWDASSQLLRSVVSGRERRRKCTSEASEEKKAFLLDMARPSSWDSFIL